MDETRRLNFLEALEIPQWVARTPLPAAKESQYLESLFVDSQGPEEISGDTTVVESRPELKQENLKVLERPAETISSTGNKINEAELEVSLPKQDQGDEQKGALASIDLLLMGRMRSYGILLERPAGVALNSEESALLKNICKAVDKLFSGKNREFINECNEVTEDFRWPIVNQHGKARNFSDDSEVMADATNAFVNASLKRNRQQTLIILGDELSLLLDQEKLRDQGIKLVKGNSLAGLQENHTSKSILWENILKVVG